MFKPSWFRILTYSSIRTFLCNSPKSKIDIPSHIKQRAIFNKHPRIPLKDGIAEIYIDESNIKYLTYRLVLAIGIPIMGYCGYKSLALYKHDQNSIFNMEYHKYLLVLSFLTAAGYTWGRDISKVIYRICILSSGKQIHIERYICGVYKKIDIMDIIKVKRPSEIKQDSEYKTYGIPITINNKKYYLPAKGKVLYPELFEKIMEGKEIQPEFFKSD